MKLHFSYVYMNAYVQREAAERWQESRAVYFDLNHVSLLACAWNPVAPKFGPVLSAISVLMVIKNQPIQSEKG